MYHQYPPWGFNPWAGPAGYFQPDWVPARPPFRPYMHDKRTRFNYEDRSRDAIVVQGNQSLRRDADGRKYNGDNQRMWVPKSVKNTETTSVDDSVQGKTGNTEETGSVLADGNKRTTAARRA